MLTENAADEIVEETVEVVETEEKSGRGIATFDSEKDVPILLGHLAKKWKDSEKKDVINPHVKTLIVLSSKEQVFTGTKKECSEKALNLALDALIAVSGEDDPDVTDKQVEDYAEKHYGLLDHKRDLIGKQCTLTAEEVATLIGKTSLGTECTPKIAENIRKSAEIVCQNALANSLKEKGLDSDAYKIWFRRVGGGRSCADPTKALQAAGIDIASLMM